MNFVEAVKSGFNNFHNFTGRSSRSEYWFWFLFGVLSGLVLGFIDATIFGATKTPLSTFFSIFTFIPGIAVGARRLHDIGKTGWLQLLWIIPVVGWIILIVWFCTKGPASDNRFGPDPLATA
jgi:uncharacterized membrane protein YhaH (DUF805 family)